MASSSNNPFGLPSNGRARPSSSSPNADALPTGSSIWPFSDPTLLFYFDPFSAKVASFKTELEAHIASKGRPFPSTNLIERATHVVLDPDCNQNLPLLSLPLPERVVTLQWLEDRTLRRTGYEGQRFQAEEEVEEPEEESDDLEEDEVVDPEVVSSQARPACDYVDARYASRGGWLKSEEEQLARYLASDPQPDENGRNIWNQYRDEHPSRTADGYRKHYESRRDAYFDSKIAELNGEPLIFERMEEEEEEEEAPPPVAAHPSLPKRRHPKSTRRELFTLLPPQRQGQPLLSIDLGAGCFRCGVKRSSQWYQLVGKDNRRFCEPCRTSVRTETLESDKAALAAWMGNGPSERRVEAVDDSEDSNDSDLDSDDSQRLRARTAPSTLVSRTSGEGRGSGIKIAWSRKEDADLVSLLSRRQGTKSEVWLALSAKHPRRTAHSAQQHYHRHTRRIDREVEALVRHERKQKKKTFVRSNFDESEEEHSMKDDEGSEVLTRSFGDRDRSSETRTKSTKRRRIESSPPRNAVASSSKVTLDHHPHRHRHSLPSSSRPFALSSHPSRYQPRPSLTNPPPQHTQTQARRPTSPLTSPSLSPAPEPAAAPPSPPPSNSNPGPSIRRPSPEIQSLEPPSFLAIGARPSTSSPYSNWCYFCGSDSQPQHTFASLALAGPKSLEDQEVIKAPERLACWTCAKVYRTRVVDGKKLAKGVKEMGELERLAWVTVVLLEKGIEERKFRVYGQVVV